MLNDYLDSLVFDEYNYEMIDVDKTIENLL